jgi:cytochrome b6-f complex iron-sulfur subunit
VSEEASPKTVGRRALLRCCAGAACAPALLEACAPRAEEPIAIEVGSPVNELISVPVQRVPELSQPGGSLLFHSTAKDFLGRPLSLLVANTSSQGLKAWDAYCPHAGCEVGWSDGADEVVCPCHLSRFSVDGAVKQPPARDNLGSYGAKLSSDRQMLIIDLSGSAGLFPAVQNGHVTFAISTIPALTRLGGSATGRAQGVPFPLVLLRTSPSQVLAFDARCPHLGCPVEGAQQLFICPCHGSLFGLDGSVKQGPATSPMTALPATFDGATVSVKVA